MDFIERIFGLSPDGGSGLFELLLVMLALVGFVLRRTRARSSLLTTTSIRGGRRRYGSWPPNNSSLRTALTRRAEPERW